MRYTHGQGSVPEDAWKFSVIYVPFLALHFWGVAVKCQESHMTEWALNRCF